MNKVELLGRMVRDPEIRYASGENANANCRFTVAVNRKFKNKETGQYDADFISCVAFNQQAEFVNKWFHKGDPIVVDGWIRTGSYTNKEGVKVYTTEVSVDGVEFVPGVKNGENTTATAPSQAATDGFMNIPDTVEEELPF
jgi:single-strand DNA-binding protein